MNFNIGTYSFGMDSDLTLAEKFKKAGEMGYKGIEILLNDIDNNSVEDLKKWAADAGVELFSIHAALDGNEAERLAKFAAIGGRTYYVPSYNFATKDEAKELAEKLNELGKLAKPYGITVGYHNHTTEFFVDEGQPIEQWLIDFSDPELVKIQLDCGWATAAGIDAVEFIKKNSGRISAIHVKECNGLLGTGTPHSSKEPKRQMPKFELDENGKPIFPPEFLAMMKQMEERNKVQCRMGDASSLINWFEVKKALDAQPGITADWTVERESNYEGDRLHCIAEDAAWLIENIK